MVGSFRMLERQVDQNQGLAAIGNVNCYMATCRAYECRSAAGVPSRRGTAATTRGRAASPTSCRKPWAA